MSWTAIGYTVSAVFILAGLAAIVVAGTATWGARDGEDTEAQGYDPMDKAAGH